MVHIKMPGLFFWAQIFIEFSFREENIDKIQTVQDWQVSYIREENPY
jgi:hypothetical protein